MCDAEGTDNTDVTRERILDFIIQYKRMHDGNAPSMREISKACAIVVSGVKHHLTQLEMQNRIRTLSKRSRTIEIVGAHWTPPEEHPGAGESNPGADEDTGSCQAGVDRIDFVS